MSRSCGNCRFWQLHFEPKNKFHRCENCKMLQKTGIYKATATAHVNVSGDHGDCSLNKQFCPTKVPDKFKSHPPSGRWTGHRGIHSRMQIHETKHPKQHCAWDAQSPRSYCYYTGIWILCACRCACDRRYCKVGQDCLMLKILFMLIQQFRCSNVSRNSSSFS